VAVGLRDSAPQRFRHQAQGFTSIGKAVQLKFREHQLAVDFDLEDAAPALDQGRPDARGLLEFGGKTGRPRQVVSNAAVGDADLFHGRGGTMGCEKRRPQGVTRRPSRPRR
jgi:hypothetical protein